MVLLEHPVESKLPQSMSVLRQTNEKNGTSVVILKIFHLSSKQNRIRLLGERSNVFNITREGQLPYIFNSQDFIHLLGGLLSKVAALN